MRLEGERRSFEQNRPDHDALKTLQRSAVDQVMADMYNQTTTAWRGALRPIHHVHGAACTVGCMDDGFPHAKAHLRAPPGIDITRGVSLGESIVRTADHVKKMGATLFRSHIGCGAAGLAYIELLKRGQLPMGIYDADTFARWYGDAVASEADIEHEFVSQLDRPNDYHPARALVIPPRGMCVSAALPHDLSAFVLSQERFDPQNILLANNIARSKHGALHESADPFNVMLIDDRQPHGEVLARDLKERFSGGSIHVHTITI